MVKKVEDNKSLPEGIIIASRDLMHSDGAPASGQYILAFMAGRYPR